MAAAQEPTNTETQPLEPRFLEALNQVISSLPKDEAIVGSVRKRLESIWMKPRLEDISIVLNRDSTISIGEAREMIFFPNSSNAKDYCTLIKPPTDDTGGTDNPQVKVQIEFLTILYLLHIPHGSWPHFIEGFILSGGLDALSMSFTHPNLYLRGQAVDAFLQITSSKSFDWWAPISISASGKQHSSRSQVALHLKLLELSKSEYFIPGLQVNADAAQSWPGGPTQCLQLLAFWLSWCRTMYTIGQSLQLSRSLLASIQEWGESRSDVNAALSKAYEDIDTTIVPPELIEFRSRMYNDFSREVPIEGPEFNNAGVRCPMVKGLVFLPDSDKFTKYLEPVIELGDNGSFDLSDTPTPPSSSSSSLSSSSMPPIPPESKFIQPVGRDFSCIVTATPQESARERGNKAFAAEDLETALSAYNEALEQMTEVSEGRELAVVQCNRATVFLGLSKRLEDGDQKNELLMSSIEASRCSVKADKTYAKASYRLAQCLEASGHLREALSALRSSQLLNDDAMKKKSQQKKNSRVPKSELAEIAATEKLFVHLMEKLALEIEAKKEDQTLTTSQDNVITQDKVTQEDKEDKEATSDKKSLKTKVSSTIELCPDNKTEDKALELEASILMKILRRKDAKTRHDYLAERSNAPETVLPSSHSSPEDDEDDDGGVKEEGGLISDENISADKIEELNKTENALVPVPKKKQQLSDREVSILAEEDSEKLARNMIELSKGEDSDDDDVIARIKLQKEKNLKKKIINEKKEQQKSSNENITSNMLCGEEIKGQNVLKKIAHSSSSSSSSLSSSKSSKSSSKSSKSTVNNKKEKKDKKEKKSQMDEMRRIANSAPPSTFAFD